MGSIAVNPHPNPNEAIIDFPTQFRPILVYFCATRVKHRCSEVEGTKFEYQTIMFAARIEDNLTPASKMLKTPAPSLNMTM
jgi:hypothetical protein